MRLEATATAAGEADQAASGAREAGLHQERGSQALMQPSICQPGLTDGKELLAGKLASCKSSSDSGGWLDSRASMDKWPGKRASAVLHLDLAHHAPGPFWKRQWVGVHWFLSSELAERDTADDTLELQTSPQHSTLVPHTEA